MLKILLIFFSKKVSYIGSWIFILFPANIFAVSQISSITIQILLITLFFYYFIKIIKTEQNKYLIFFSINAALLIFLRGEFFLFYFFTIFFFVLKKKFKVVIVSFLITIFLVSPYLIRNYKIFGIITVTKSAGFNLFKGNNPRSTVEGSPMLNLEDIKRLSPKTYEKAIIIKKQDRYDLIIDNLYKEDAIKFILDDDIIKHNMGYQNINIKIKYSKKIKLQKKENYLVTSLENKKVLIDKILTLDPNNIFFPSPA